jgi:hypothetical protein
VPLRAALIGVRDAKDRRLVEHLADELDAKRQVAREPARHADARESGQVGSPARLALTVKMSFKYICSGSSIFSPSAHGGTGLVGIATTSTRSNACS